MNVKLKEFAKDSLLYSVGQWASRLGSLVLLPILSRIFTPSEYGVIDILTTTYAFVLMIISLNIDTGIQKHFFKYELYNKKVLLNSTITLRIVISSIVAIFMVAFAPHLSQIITNRDYYYIEIYLLAASLPFEDIYSQLILVLRLERKVISFAVYNLIQVIIQPVLTYVLVIYLQQNLKGVFIAKLVTIIILAAALMIQQRSYYFTRFSLKEAIRILKFSLPGLPAIIQGNIMGLLPRYFLLYFSNMSAVGLYSIADKISNSIEMFKASFNRAWNPFAFSNAGEIDEKYLYEKVFKLFAFCLLLLMTTLALLAKEIITLLTASSYHSAAVLVGGLSLYYALRALTLIFSTGLYSVNKVSHTSFIAIIQLIVFVISALLLVPNYHAVGLVLSLNISAVVSVVCYGLTISKYFPFNFSTRRLLISLIMAMLLVTCGYYTDRTATNADKIVRASQKLAIISIYALVTYNIILSRNERSEIKKGIKSFVAGYIST